MITKLGQRRWIKAGAVAADRESRSHGPGDSEPTKGRPSAQDAVLRGWAASGSSANNLRLGAEPCRRCQACRGLPGVGGVGVAREKACGSARRALTAPRDAPRIAVWMS